MHLYFAHKCVNVPTLRVSFDALNNFFLVKVHVHFLRCSPHQIPPERPRVGSVFLDGPLLLGRLVCNNNYKKTHILTINYSQVAFELTHTHNQDNRYILQAHPLSRHSDLVSWAKVHAPMHNANRMHRSSNYHHARSAYRITIYLQAYRKPW